MANHTLPSPRAFMTALLDSLPTSASTTTPSGIATTPSNPLTSLPESARKQILTLHVLFPNELLPALDLLDRHLVTRFLIQRKGDNQQGKNAKQQVQARSAAAPPAPPVIAQHASSSDNKDVDMRDATDNTATDSIFHKRDSIYYVRSAQRRTSRYSTSYDHTTSYEVRLHAWNCSCPAFAFAAFPSLHPDAASQSMPVPAPELSGHTVTHEGRGKPGWSFGGVRLGNAMPPVCKHLLACVLVERCEGLFGGFVEERDVSVEEAAGWAAGWGD